MLLYKNFVLLLDISLQRGHFSIIRRLDLFSQDGGTPKRSKISSTPIEHQILVSSRHLFDWNKNVGKGICIMKKILCGNFFSP